jgi:hypothetical protein
MLGALKNPNTQCGEVCWLDVTIKTIGSTQVMEAGELKYVVDGVSMKTLLLIWGVEQKGIAWRE